MTGIVALRDADAPLLAALHATAFPPAEAWSATVIGLQLAAPGGFGLLDPRGGMILARAIDREAEILTLAVDPVARRLGIARGLLHAALRAAAERGAETVFLEVAVDNLAAIGLYRGLGFTEVGRRRRYYADGTDALVMRVSPCATAGA